MGFLFWGGIIGTGYLWHNWNGGAIGTDTVIASSLLILTALFSLLAMLVVGYIDVAIDQRSSLRNELPDNAEKLLKELSEINWKLDRWREDTE